MSTAIIIILILFLEILIISLTQNLFITYVFLISLFLILPVLALVNFIENNFSKYTNTIVGKPKKDEAIEKARQEGKYVIAYLVKERTY